LFDPRGKVTDSSTELLSLYIGLASRAILDLEGLPDTYIGLASRAVFDLRGLSDTYIGVASRVVLGLGEDN